MSTESFWLTRMLARHPDRVEQCKQLSVAIDSLVRDWRPRPTEAVLLAAIASMLVNNWHQAGLDVAAQTTLLKELIVEFHTLMGLMDAKKEQEHDDRQPVKH